ncbi:hypothetical protein PoB_002165000 [Plakobranchus ocellatus]|uniref:Uncharacterized protein n=1 Tax=Plakobranchus ocellatus TaxID=259542 RepID=A0AAV3ZJ43_9GAST|nr:hypothetical protein PoB_002165000 [Plakobranchus ocellatus]
MWRNCAGELVLGTFPSAVVHQRKLYWERLKHLSAIGQQSMERPESSQDEESTEKLVDQASVRLQRPEERSICIHYTCTDIYRDFSEASWPGTDPGLMMARRWPEITKQRTGFMASDDLRVFLLAICRRLYPEMHRGHSVTVWRLCIVRFLFILGGVSHTVAGVSALRSAGTILSRVRAPLPAPRPDGEPECLRSTHCGLAK